jgi:hypothetical protein
MDVSDAARWPASDASKWSTRAEWFDWLIVAVTILLALVTLWVGSSIVRGMWDYLTVSLAWAGVGLAWSVAVLVRTTDRAAQVAILALIVGSLVSTCALGPVTALIFTEPADWILIALLVVVPLGVILVRQRPIRLVWFVAPMVVLAAAALTVSGVLREVRFAASEDELTRFVQSGEAGEASRYYDEPVMVGGVPVYEVIREEGQVLLVTGYIGILADDPAGLAYVPNGEPVGVGWEHITGPWFRWVPSGYVYD